MCIAMLAVFGTASTFAQTSASQSATSAATFRLFENDLDYAFDVTRFGLVKKDLYSASLWKNTELNLLATKKIGPLYFGFQFTGDLYNKVGTLATTNTDTGLNYGDMVEVTTQELLGNDNSVLGTNRTRKEKKENSTSTSNEINAFIGVGNGLGIIATAYHYNSITKSTYNPPTPIFTSAAGWDDLSTIASVSAANNSFQQITNGSNVIWEESTEYKEGWNGSHYLQPAATVGFRFNLGKVVFRPYAEIWGTFYTGGFDSAETYYKKAIGSGNPTYQGIPEVEEYKYWAFINGTNYTGLGILGGVLADMNGITVGVRYQFYSRLYSNKYIDLDGKEKTVAGTTYTYLHTSYYTDDTVPRDTKEEEIRAYQTTATTYLYQMLTPVISYHTSPSSDVTLAFAFKPSIYLTNKTYQETGESKKVVTYNDPNDDPSKDYVDTEIKSHQGAKTTADIFEVKPLLQGAVQYAIKPGKLILNLGAEASIANFISVARNVTRSGLDSYENIKVWGDGTTVRNYLSSLGTTRTETSRSLANLNAMSLSVKAGLCWLFSNAVRMDLLFGNGTSSNIIDASSLTLQFVMTK